MKSPRTYVTLTEELDKAVKATALHRGVSESQVIRECVEEQMKVQATVDSIDLITKIVREQLQMLMDGYVERLASISAKGTIMSATSTYLTAETISRFVPLELQMEYQEAYEQARKKGVAYLKSKKKEY
ncbi:MAG TPA: hypothetical protein IAC14_07965 [Candidatus Scybalomonas excrementigallinarum]|nr:hypothetical protein [Candidatus Scybalomonas excrementigallinarum]